MTVSDREDDRGEKYDTTPNVGKTKSSGPTDGEKSFKLKRFLYSSGRRTKGDGTATRKRRKGKFIFPLRIKGSASKETNL